MEFSNILKRNYYSQTMAFSILVLTVLTLNIQVIFSATVNVANNPSYTIQKSQSPSTTPSPFISALSSSETPASSLLSNNNTAHSLSPSSSSLVPPTKKQKLSILVLLPRNNSRMFSIRKTSPAIELAISNVTKMNVLPGYDIEILYADSKCHIAYAFNEALKYNNKVKLILGPVCDYSLAPIARQAKYWNLPMISSGAMAQAFLQRRKSLYPTLTRVGTNYQTLVDFVLQLFGHYSYKRFVIVYENAGQNKVLEKLCYLQADALHESLKNRNASDSIYNEAIEYKKEELDHILFRKKIGNEFGADTP